jgi:signal transduction histidine kinase
MFNGIGKKITLAFIVVTLSVLGAGLFVFNRIEEVHDSSMATSQNVQAVVSAAGIVQNSIFHEIWAVERFHRGDTIPAHQEFQDARKAMDEAIQVLRVSNVLNSITCDSLSALRHRFQALVLQMFETSDTLKRSRQSGNTKITDELTRIHQSMMTSLDQLHRQLEEILLVLQLRTSALSTHSQEENAHTLNEVKIALVILFALAVFVTIVAWFMIEHYVTRPLQRLTKEVKSIGSGDFGRRIHIGGDDEIKLLESSFNLMVEDLQNNIQKRREDEMELMHEHKLAAIGSLAQGIAHNLNNSLGIILLSCGALRRNDPSSEEIDFISRAVTKMKTIIDSLLHKSRQEQTEAKQEISLNNLITEELRFLELDPKFKEIGENVQFGESLPTIVGVYSDFSQSITNFIRNAMDAMYHSPTKRLSIQTRFDDQNIYVDIADSGCGIPEENIPKLFDPFFTTKPIKGTEIGGEPTGTGLGLSSCYQLLQQYNATITVKSKVGEGSMFTIAVPYNSQTTERG